MIAHDPSLVVLSVTIAILGAFTACVMVANLRALTGGERRARLIMASIALGGSLWSMQFVGLLSLDAPINLGWLPELLAASAVAALAGTTAALLLFGGREEIYRGRHPAATIIFGITIVSTNYLGVIAIAGLGLKLAWFLTLVGIGVSVQVAHLLLEFLFRRKGVIHTLAGSTGLGLCLSATHYLAIASTQGLEQTLLAIPPYDSGISERYLAWSATIMMYLICSICLCIFVIGQFRDEVE